MRNSIYRTAETETETYRFVVVCPKCGEHEVDSQKYDGPKYCTDCGSRLTDWYRLDD